MSANRLKNTKKRFEDVFKKDLTPKNSKPLNKISPVYSSFRGGLTIKSQLNSKTKIMRPLTSKNSSQSNNYFHSRDDKKNSYSSTKKFKKEEPMRKPLTPNQYEYQPRSKSKSPAKHPDEIIRLQMEVKYPTHVSNKRQMRQYKNQHPELPKKMATIINFQKAKHSSKSNQLIKAYAASTNQGPVRQYNQDRVAIILNISRPEHCTEWKKAAYFGVFDGHGGVDCADYLRDNLHLFISKEKSFPNNMESALKAGFDKCQKTFVEHSRHNKLDKSGTCAIVTFFYGDTMYVANVGDSRAIMSSNFGEKIVQLSLDHKASDQYEQKRIFDAGGRIYQTKLMNSNPNIKIFYEGQQHAFILGPHRVMPGRLSVTRTFGDIEAKLPQLKGNPKAIINQPEMMSIRINGDQDFVLLGSDGIFDKLNNQQIIEMVWETIRKQQDNFKNIHELCGLAVENIMRFAFHKKTLDNITVVMIALEGLHKYFAQKQLNRSNQSSFNKTIVADSTRHKIATKYESSFERKYMGRSTSPSNYTSLRSHSFYRN